MIEDAEWWFNMWTVRRNEEKEEECGRQRMESGGSTCGLLEGMRRRKRNEDGRG